MCSFRFLWIASSPKNVKNRFASIPSARAPLAMIRPGYTPSSEPLEMMTETLVIGSGLAASLIVVAFHSNAAAGFGDAGDLGCHLRRALGEQLVELLHRDPRGLAEHSHRRSRALLRVFGAH